MDGDRKQIKMNEERDKRIKYDEQKNRFITRERRRT